MIKPIPVINREGTQKLDTYQMVRKSIRNRPEPEIFTLNCPTQQVLDIIGNKWSVICNCSITTDGDRDLPTNTNDKYKQ